MSVEGFMSDDASSDAAADNDTTVRGAQNEREAAKIGAARIARLPPFWKNEPEIWFMQVEAAFGTARITREETKYQYLVANLDTSVLPFVADILRNPPTNGKYEKIKKRILSLDIRRH